MLCITFFHYHSDFNPVLYVCVGVKHIFFCVSVLKKVKHRLVENMSSGTADALGLSRAILCNGEIIIIIIMSIQILLLNLYR